MLTWLEPFAPPENLSSAALMAYAIFDMFLIIVLARLLGSLMVRVGQPRVVGEILAGILLGPTLLGDDLSQVLAPMQVRPILSLVAMLGLILFMFLAGVEYDARRVKGRQRQATILAFTGVAIPILLGFPLAQVMHGPLYAGALGQELLPFAMFLGAALSVTAFPVMAHILMERGELNSAMGALAVAATGIMSVLMFTYIALAGAVAAASGFRDLLLKIGLTIVFGGVSWFLVRPLLKRILPHVAEGQNISGNHMGILFSGMLLYGLIAHLIGINALVGGFLWGFLLPDDLALRQSVAAKIRDVAIVMLLPVFFAMAGFSTDLKLLSMQTLPVIGLVLLAAIAGKFISAIPAKGFGVTWPDVLKIGALFNTRGLLVLVVGLIGLQLQIITRLTFTIIVVVALVTNLMTLPVMNVVTRRQEMAETPMHDASSDPG